MPELIHLLPVLEGLLLMILIVTTKATPWLVSTVLQTLLHQCPILVEYGAIPTHVWIQYRSWDSMSPRLSSNSASHCPRSAWHLRSHSLQIVIARIRITSRRKLDGRQRIKHSLTLLAMMWMSCLPRHWALWSSRFWITLGAHTLRAIFLGLYLALLPRGSIIWHWDLAHTTFYIQGQHLISVALG